MLKKGLMAMMALAAGALLAGDIIWNGNPTAVKPSSSQIKATLAVENNEIVVTGTNTGKGYEYIAFDIVPEPFVIGDKCIGVEFFTETPEAGDSFYVKALSEQGRNVLSFMTYNVQNSYKRYICIPDCDSRDGMKWFKGDIRAERDEPIVKIRIFLGRKQGLGPIRAHLRNMTLTNPPEFPKKAECVDLGVGIPSAELRNYTAFTDAKGHPFVLSMLLDMGKPYVLLTDAMTGENLQYYVPDGVYGQVFGGVLTGDGKFVWGLNKAVIFDVNTREYTVSGRAPGSTLCAYDSKDGTVYMGSAPQARMVSVNPKTGEYHDWGRMDDGEDYLSHLAEDKEGYIYCGIGTARGNIVALNPKTGERIQVLPEEERAWGTAHVYAGTDGYVYGNFKGFQAKMLAGKIVEKNAKSPGRAIDRSVHYGTRHSEFGNGMKVREYNLNERYMVIQYQDGSTKKFAVDYVSGGLDLTSMARGPQNDVYFSSAHPHHLGHIVPAEDKVINLGYNNIVSGGNFCNMVAAAGKLYAGEYAGGRMWMYDPLKPYFVGANTSAMKNFGVPFSEIVSNSDVSNGHWTILGMGVLFGYGENGENSFKVNLKAPAPGSYYLNFQLYRYGSYGTVTVKAGGTENKYNVQDDKNSIGPIVNLGPFEVKDKVFPVEFSVQRNDNASSSFFFSLIGLELSKTAAVQPQKEPEKQNNPCILGTWKNLITRPRTIAVHPSGDYVVVGGYANYGLTGGGLGIHNLKTGENTEIINENLVPGESCICMEFLPDGNLIGGTSMDAPGGGHLVSKTGSVFVLDWNARKADRFVHMEKATNVIAIAYWNGLIFAGANDNKLHVIDPATMKILASHDVSSGGFMLRNGLQKSEDGKELYLVMNKEIFKVNPKTNAPDDYLVSTVGFTGGGPIIGDRMYLILEGVKVGYVKMLK